MSKSKLGQWLKRVAPRIYEYATLIIADFKFFFADKRPYLTDSLGGDFKAFIKNDLDSDSYEKFKHGFDDESITTISVLMHRFEILENQKFAFNKKPVRIENLLELEKDFYHHIVINHLNMLERRFKGIAWEESVGYFNHGLVFLPEDIKNKLKNTTVLDVGSFIGDSALMLEELGFNRIISFDISRKSTLKYYENISKYATNKGIFSHELLALSDSSGDVITLSDNGSAGMSILRRNPNVCDYEVLSMTVDEFCIINNIKPSCIKADMEGFAYKMITGAKQTILSSKPVLCLAVYHNPEEFFKIKLFLQQLVPSYRFLLRKLTSKIIMNHCHSEVFLIAYDCE